jgi:2-polyprenyl-6-methoxyphenol hydroxylase-like FAD-dependent oxidoreductase
MALTRAGWNVQILERAAAPRELGFGLMLAPNAMRALDRLGVAGTIRTLGHTPRSVEIRTTDGRLLRAFRTAAGSDVERFLPVIALRPALYGTLLDALAPESVFASSEVVGFEEGSRDVRVRTADGREFTGDVLVGADGVASRIRRRLHPHEPPASPSLYCGLRGVVFDAQRFMPELDALAVFGPGLEAAAVRASDDAIYWYASMLAADVPADRGPAEIRDQRLRNTDARFHAIASATSDAHLRFDQFLG